MAKRYLTLVFFLVLCTQLKAQQYGLFNTKTLFDAFENPAQKAFVLDSSRKYASNFLLPYFGVNAANKGEANLTLRNVINGNKFDTSDLPIGNNDRNKVYQNSNIYVFAFRIFESHKYNKELGFSWQIRSDAFADYTNETLVAINNYNRFIDQQKDGLFNGSGYGQSYHQFSVNYRENYNKRLAFGVKFSLLSGITYNNADITRSTLSIDPFQNQLTVGLTGTYKSSFLHSDELSSSTLFPNFKNPGASVGFGTIYTSKTGIFLMGSVKDLGFIRWNNDSHSIFINQQIVVDKIANNNNALQNELDKTLTDADQRKGFYTPTNAKMDFLISKKFQFYTPNFIVSKYLFNNGGDVVLVNNFKYNDVSVSVTPGYNLNGFVTTGVQAMYQTPNFEFFLGSDNLLKTTAIKQQAAVNNGYLGASAYMGVAIKFGYVVEHPQNSSYMPGVGDDQETSFFSKLFSIFKSKK